MRKAAEHFQWIDSLRFLAAVAVMVEHIYSHNHVNWSSLPPEAQTVSRYVGLIPTRLGREAVILFFVISGFLVGGRLIERVRAGTFDLRDYALDRATRVYVPLLPALGLTLAVSLAIGLPVDARQYLGNAVGLQGAGVKLLVLNTPLWSLSFETWFYVGAGAVAVLLTPGAAGARGKWLAGAAVLLSARMFMVMDATFLFCWLIGAGAYGLRHAVGARRGLLGTMAAVLAVAGCAGYQVANNVIPINPSWQELAPPVEVCELALAAGLSVLVACLSGAVPATPLGKGIERAGGRLAAFSYTLYLVHYPVMCYLLVKHPWLGGHIEGRAAARAAICTAAAVVMYAGFEAHTARVRRWLRSRGRRPATASGQTMFPSRTLPAA